MQTYYLLIQLKSFDKYTALDAVKRPSKCSSFATHQQVALNSKTENEQITVTASTATQKESHCIPKVINGQNWKMMQLSLTLTLFAVFSSTLAV